MPEKKITELDSQPAPSGIYSPKDYWSSVAQATSSEDENGLAPVLHPGAPAWFNETIDKLQHRAVRRALHLAGVTTGAHMLDVGCGTGRWLRRYQRYKLRALGLDATPSMLALAREYGTTADLVAGEAYRLPFADARFDCVSDITVVQHIPVSRQAVALGEMMRVLKPNGRLILLELIHGTGSHIFPRRPQQWIEQAGKFGAVLVGWFGQEYLILDRVFVRAARALSRNGHDSNITPLPDAGLLSRRPTVARRAYWSMRRLTAPVSAWIEPMAECILPRQLATHGVFVFRKP